MEKINNYLLTIMHWILNVLLIGITGFLFVVSIFRTSIIYENEKTIYYTDFFLKHLAVICLFIFVLYFIKHKNLKMSPKLIAGIKILWIFFLSGWILFANVYPTSDQYAVMEAGAKLLQGDFIDWKRDGYIFQFPYQNGIVLLFALVQKIFGLYNYKAIQFMNLIALYVLLHFTEKICTIIFHGDEEKNILDILFILFLPISFSVVWVYGNLVGLCMAVLSLWGLISYIYYGKQKYVIIMVGTIAVAIAFKSNYYVFLIAEIILIFINAIKESNWKRLFLIIGTLLFVIIANQLVYKVSGFITDEKIPKGVPAISFVAMGLQDDATKEAGWYNAYMIGIYMNHDYDEKETSKEAIESIKASIEKMKSNPKYMIDFWKRKILSQWNNPTFQEWDVFTDNCITDNKIILKIARSEEVEKVITEYLNLLQSVILFGAGCYFISERKKRDFNQRIFGIIIIGGFLFQMMWEAKSLYCMYYFILFLPYAAKGYKNLINKSLN